jgi:hypothetical protein
MREPFALPFSHPIVNRIVRTGFPGAKTRRPIKIECRSSYHVSDYWDGGSRSYCAFIQLSTMSGVSSEALPKESRQKIANPFNLPIADITIQPGYAVCEHTIFCGKDLGYRLYLSPGDILSYLPEAKILVPAPEVPELTEGV